MGYFALPTDKNCPYELINNIKANLKLYKDKITNDDYLYLLDVFVQSDLDKIEELLKEREWTSEVKTHTPQEN